MSQAYNDGKDAFHRGDLPEHNPYDERDAQYQEWLYGYIEEDAKEAGEYE